MRCIHHLNKYCIALVYFLANIRNTTDSNPMFVGTVSSARPITCRLVVQLAHFSIWDSVFD